MQRDNSLEKTQMLGKIEGRMRRGWQRIWRFDGIIDSAEFEQVLGNKMTEKPGVLQSMGLQRVGHDWETEQQMILKNLIFEV